MGGVVTAAAVIGAAGTVYAADQAGDAADDQIKAGNNALNYQIVSDAQARADLQPFRRVGTAAAPLLRQLTTTEGEAEYLNNNPHFDAAVQQTLRDTQRQYAGTGKSMSGQFREDLFRRNYGLRDAFLNSRFNRLLQATNVGQSSAAGQANITQNTAGNVGNILMSQGNAAAAGRIGRVNAINNGLDQAVGTLSYYDSRRAQPDDAQPDDAPTVRRN